MLESEQDQIFDCTQICTLLFSSSSACDRVQTCEKVLTNAALCDNANVLPAELLLKLPDQALLNSVEALEQAERHVNDDGLARV